MQEAIRIIQDEHRSIAAVIQGLRYLINETLEKGLVPNFPVFRAMLDYIVAFPERLHHPKEDQYLFGAIRARSHEATALLDELQAEHVRGAQLITQLQDALLAYEQSPSANGSTFREIVEDYANFHWAHMRREEDLILPIAERVLTEADWSLIERAFKENDNPLFGIKPKEEFEKLFHRVVTLAPPPIGVGPSAFAFEHRHDKR